MKIPKSFGAGLFTRHKEQYEGREPPKDVSRAYYFLPSTTDRSEKINQHMEQVLLIPIDIEECDFGEGFNPALLDSDHPDREKTRERVLTVLKKIGESSNSCLRRNADALLSKIGHREFLKEKANREFLKEKFALTY